MRTVKKFSIAFAKWVFIACAVGVIGGIVGSLFHMAVNFATGFRECHSWTLYLMPLAGLFIIFSYRVCKVNEETGTNLIISSVRGNIKVPLLMAPLIFLGTVLTHLTGGSAGREGAALQLGGNVVSVHHERASEDSDITDCLLRLVLETRNFDHIREIRQALTAAGFKIVNK